MVLETGSFWRDHQPMLPNITAADPGRSGVFVRLQKNAFGLTFIGDGARIVKKNLNCTDGK